MKRVKQSAGSTNMKHFSDGSVLTSQPELKLADPICTYIFSVLVLFTTVRIIRDTIIIVLEGKSRSPPTGPVTNILEKGCRCEWILSFHWSWTKTNRLEPFLDVNVPSWRVSPWLLTLSPVLRTIQNPSRRPDLTFRFSYLDWWAWIRMSPWLVLWWTSRAGAGCDEGSCHTVTRSISEQKNNKTQRKQHKHAAVGLK